MRCAIIDDEPLAVDVIETYINQIDGMEVTVKCHNPIEAIGFLKKMDIDLVFLDIEMPNLTGIDLINIMDNIPQFIFTTAYPQYALEGFELNATDYLVKPISFQRFLKAVSRAKERHQLEHKNTANFTSATPLPAPPSPNKFIFVKSEYENVKININTIKYIQGLKDYIKIYTTDSKKSILTLSSFKDILEKLPTSEFIRVHRSYIINVNAIKALQKTKIVLDNNIRVPIGETFKDQVFKDLGV
ncbi:DNA-binding response regulator [Aureibaculum marinum]|uniref:DNA-binding response regulator n=1 Tax=Aureibaculum marinum TaxID=2487930 RepID=A0A3N4P0Z9_9FLAO|nr:LytTR family DNA-binding domain-containing protein [Aureibaculum marinum]RPE00818.1 DNA-binding response regulator [Aureibaculum marinum]